MVLLGAFAYQTSSDLLKESSIRQLDAVAESKARDLVKVKQGWKDQLTLIRNGSELQAILNAYQAGDTESLRQLTHLVDHAAAAVQNVEQITLTDVNGNTMSWGDAPDYGEIPLPTKSGEIKHGGSFMDEQGEVRVVFSTLLTRSEHSHDNMRLISGNPVDTEIVGHMEIVFDTDDLDTVTDDYTGLGETGEVVLVALRDNDTVIVLNSPRHIGSMQSRIIPLAETSEVVQTVLSGESRVFLDGFNDYRGEKVWAATRFLPEFNWGLIVKVDASEEGLRADALLDAMFDIGIALSAFAIIGGTFMGFYLARPIHELAVLVGRVRAGETNLRASFDGDDEIAYLAESLNELLDHVRAGSPPEDPGTQIASQISTQDSTEKDPGNNA